MPSTSSGGTLVPWSTHQVSTVVRSLDRTDTVRDPGAVIPWFYRLLRNAVIDHHRRRGAEDRALAYAAGTADEAAPGADEELRDEVCAASCR